MEVGSHIIAQTALQSCILVLCFTFPTWLSFYCKPSNPSIYLRLFKIIHNLFIYTHTHIIQVNRTSGWVGGGGGRSSTIEDVTCTHLHKCAEKTDPGDSPTPKKGKYTTEWNISYLKLNKYI